MAYFYTAISDDHQTNPVTVKNYKSTMMVEGTMPAEQNHNINLIFGIITTVMVVIILVGAVVILATLFLRKKLGICAIQSHTVNYDQDHLYDKIFRATSSTNPRENVQQNKVTKVPVYEEVQLQDAIANESDQYEKVEFSRCPAYEESNDSSTN